MFLCALISARYHQDYDTLGVKSACLSQRYYHQALALLPDVGKSVQIDRPSKLSLSTFVLVAAVWNEYKLVDDILVI